MPKELFVQCLLNGFMLAVIYTLIALGLTLVFGIMKIVNFAHGEIYMLGAMFTYYFVEQTGVNYFLALTAAIILTACLGFLLERIFFRPTLGNFEASLVVGLGLLLVFQSGALLVFGIEEKSLISPFSGIARVLGATVAMNRLAIIPFAVIIIATLLIFVEKAKAGKAMRAVAEDPEAAQLMGIKVGRISSLSMAIGSALAGAAGGLIMPVFLAEPAMGGPALLKAFVIIVLGGMGSISGVLVAGLLLGMIDSFGATLFGGPISALIGFVMLIGVLLVKPTGLLGHKE